MAFKIFFIPTLELSSRLAARNGMSPDSRTFPNSSCFSTLAYTITENLNVFLELSWFLSTVPDPQAEAVDAMSQSWTQAPLYMFPPFGLIPVVLRKPTHQAHHMVALILLWNEGVFWFPLLDTSAHRLKQGGVAQSCACALSDTLM